MNMTGKFSTVAALGLILGLAASARADWVDNFDGPGFDARWSFDQPNTGIGEFVFDDAGDNARAVSYDNMNMWDARQDAPMLWAPTPAGDFYFETRVSASTTVGGTVAGITVYDGDGSVPNFALGLDHWNLGGRVVKLQGLGTDNPSISVPATGGEAWLRLEAYRGAGVGGTDRYVTQYKLNEIDSWSTLATLDRTVPNARAGLFLKATDAANDKIADFSYAAMGEIVPDVDSQAANLANYQAAVRSEPSLLSYYTFDGDTAAQITDSQPAARHGTSVGNVAFDSATPSGAGQALLLDGTGYVSLGTFDAFNFTDGTGTIEAWIRPDWTSTAPGGNVSWFAVRDSAGTRYSLHADQNAPPAKVMHWNNSTVLSANTALGNDWRHVVSTVDATGRKFYVDGKLVGSHAQGLVGPTGKPAFIGASTGAGTERWIGAIDEVAVYADALSAEQVWAHSLGRQLEQVWDFESGTLDGFQAVPYGDPAADLVFTVPGNQPVTPTGFDMATIQGDKIIRTWQNTVSGNGDHRTGIAQTDEFVLGPGAQFDFLIGGGPHVFTGDPDAPAPNITALNLERKVGDDDWEMIFTASGPAGNYMLEQDWDASAFAGETVRLRIYDTSTGSWGHIAVDYIRYATIVPEPGTLSLLALGAFGLLLATRRRRNG